MRWMGAYGGWSNKPQLGLGNWWLESLKIEGIYFPLLIIFLAIAYLLVHISLVQTEFLDAILIPPVGCNYAILHQTAS